VFKKTEAERASLENEESYISVLEHNFHVRREKAYKIHVIDFTKLDIHYNRISPQQYNGYIFFYIAGNPPQQCCENLKYPN